MESAENGASAKLSDDLTALCDVLASIRKETSNLYGILARITDRREANAARRMIGAEGMELMRLAATR